MIYLFRSLHKYADRGYLIIINNGDCNRGYEGEEDNRLISGASTNISS